MDNHGITKDEMNTLKKLGYTFSKEQAGGQEIRHVLMIVHNPSKRHDSGYPFIRAFGVRYNNKNKKTELIDMGWHDHYLIYTPINVDAIHKNIFKIMAWGFAPYRGYPFKIADGFISCSTLEVDENGVWS